MELLHASELIYSLRRFGCDGSQVRDIGRDRTLGAGDGESLLRPRPLIDQRARGFIVWRAIPRCSGSSQAKGSSG